MKTVLNRHSIRLKSHDYSLPGEYFITIDVRHFECLLGEVVEGEMIPNEFGRIVENTWADLPNHYNNIELDVFQVMPNHFHGIIVISEEEKENAPVGAKVMAIHEFPLPDLPLPELTTQEQTALDLRLQRRKMLLFKVIGRFKMKASKDINALRGTEGVRFWHRNYHEHIIRNLMTMKTHAIISSTILQTGQGIIKT